MEGRKSRIAAERQRIVDLALSGMGPRQIAAQPGITASISNISVVLCLARKAGTPVPRFPSGNKNADTAGGVEVRIDIVGEEEIAALDRAVRARGLTRKTLVERLVTVVLAEDMIGAVLDDGVADGD